MGMVFVLAILVRNRVSISTNKLWLLQTIGYSWIGYVYFRGSYFFCHLFQSRRPAIKALHKAFNIHLSLGTNYTEGLKPGID